MKRAQTGMLRERRQIRLLDTALVEVTDDLRDAFVIVHALNLPRRDGGSTRFLRFVLFRNAPMINEPVVAIETEVREGNFHRVRRAAVDRDLFKAFCFHRLNRTGHAAAGEVEQHQELILCIASLRAAVPRLSWPCGRPMC